MKTERDRWWQIIWHDYLENCYFKLKTYKKCVAIMTHGSGSLLTPWVENHLLFSWVPCDQPFWLIWAQLMFWFFPLPNYRSSLSDKENFKTNEVNNWPIQMKGPSFSFGFMEWVQRETEEAAAVTVCGGPGRASLSSSMLPLGWQPRRDTHRAGETLQWLFLTPLLPFRITEISEVYQPHAFTGEKSDIQQSLWKEEDNTLDVTDLQHATSPPQPALSDYFKLC